MKRIGLFIDGSNIYASARALGFKVDFTKLLTYYKDQGEVVNAFYFTALPPKDVESPLRRMVDYVRYNGFSVIEKETREYIDPEGIKKLKGNMDVEIAVYAAETAVAMTHMVLYSGDGDFRCLIESMQRRHNIHCTVVAARNLTANVLRSQANEYIDLVTLRDRFFHTMEAAEPVKTTKRWKLFSE